MAFGDQRSPCSETPHFDERLWPLTGPVRRPYGSTVTTAPLFSTRF